MRSDNSFSSKGSFFGLSGMWMKTLWRRDIIVCFVALIAYFCTTILPMVFNFRSFDLIAGYYSEMLLPGSLSPTAFITVIYAISLSVMLFDYLHDTASTAALHSFPVTRGKLFRTTVLTGTALLLLPILIIAAGMFIAGRLMPPVAVGKGMVVPSDILSLKACAGWFIDTAVGGIFTFAIANLAGIIAGKNVIHALLAYLFNGITAMILLLIDTYANAFILGSYGTDFTALAQKTHPFIWYTAEREGALSLSDAPMMLAFVGVALLITVLTGLLYKSIKLEREQNATVFPVVSDLLVIFCSFCVMSMVGMITATLQNTDASVLPVGPFLFGSLIGGIGAFIVFRMIADSSVRIFHPRSFVNFIAFVLISCVVFAFTCFDITGQAARIPDTKDVARVEVETVDPFDSVIELSDKESIENVITLHKAVLDHKDEKDAFTNGESTDISIVYKLKNGRTLNRRYSVDLRKMSDVKDAAETLGSSPEYLKKVENHLRKVILYSKDGSYIYTSKADVNIKKEDIRPLINAYMKDYKANGFKYYYDLSMSEEIGDNANWDYTNQKAGSIDIVLDPSFENRTDLHIMESNLTFGKKDKHVHAFLKEKGYAKKLIKKEARYNSEEDA